jgi:hypothetical protein
MDLTNFAKLFPISHTKYRYLHLRLPDYLDDDDQIMYLNFCESDFLNRRKSFQIVENDAHRRESSEITSTAVENWLGKMILEIKIEWVLEDKVCGQSGVSWKSKRKQ